jgi:hypothetical protein
MVSNKNSCAELRLDGWMHGSQIALLWPVSPVINLLHLNTFNRSVKGTKSANQRGPSGPLGFLQLIHLYSSRVPRRSNLEWRTYETRRRRRV